VPDVYRLATSVVATAAGMVLCSPAGHAQIVTGNIPPPRPILTNPFNPPKTALLSSGAHRLNVSASLFGAHDRNDFPTSTTSATGSPTSGSTTSVPVYRRSGSRAGGNGSLNYGFTHMGERTSVGANGLAGVNAYSRTGRPLYTGSGGLYLQTPVGRASRFSLTGTSRYSPYYNFGLFAGLGGGVDPNDLAASVDPDLGLAVTPLRSFHHTALGSLSHQFSLRTSMSLDYRVAYTDFVNGTSDFLDQYGGIRLSHQVTRGLGVNLGYRYGLFRTVAGSSHGLNTVDAGVSYNKAFSVTRRTTFGFSTGSTILTRPASGTGRLLGRRVFLTGRADLDHQIGQTWSAQLSYRREASGAPGLSGLFLNDTVTAGVGGAVSRRMTLGATNSYLSGAVASETVARHDSYHANGVANFSLTSWASCFGHYSYYRYRLGQAIVLPPGFPDRLERHSVRAGVSLGFRLIG